MTRQLTKEVEQIEREFNENYPDAWRTLPGEFEAPKKSVVLSFADDHNLFETFADMHFGLKDYDHQETRQRFKSYLAERDPEDVEGILMDLFSLLAYKRMG